MSALNRLAGRMTGLRLNQDLSQEQVAEALGIKRARLSHYEHGRREPDIEMLIKIADLHKVSLDYLLGREQKREELING